MVKSKNDFLSKIRYFTNLITHSFFVSIICLLSLFGLIILVYVGDLLFNMNNDSFNMPLFSAYVVVSPSMNPTISVNDAIIVKRVDHDNYKVGDIITFLSPDSNKDFTITHRIVDKEIISSEESLYSTKGDNNKVKDFSKVNTKSIYGKVLFVIPKVGYIRKLFSSPINFFRSFITLVLFVFLFLICRIFYMLSLKRDS